MKGKILLLAGLGVGYVLGAKAGRERYNDIKRITDKFWHSTGVQKQVHNAEGFVKDRAPDVAGLVAKGARKVVDQVSGSGHEGTRKASTARPDPRPAQSAGPAPSED